MYRKILRESSSACLLAKRGEVTDGRRDKEGYRVADLRLTSSSRKNDAYSLVVAEEEEEEEEEEEVVIWWWAVLLVSRRLWDVLSYVS